MRNKDLVKINKIESLNTETINIQTIEIYSDSLLKNNPVLFDKLKIIAPKEGNVTPNDLLIEVLKFMYLVSVFGVKLTPSKIVDLGWHEFILFTKAYEKFCNEKLGKFIHHTPDVDKAANNRNFLKTIQHYIQLFGKPPDDIWGELSTTEWSDSQCGSCNSN